MELTKLGLGMTEATGLLRRHVWALFVTAGPGTAHAGNLVTSATVSPAPSAHPAGCPLSEIDFKEQVFRGCHYYFILSVITTPILKMFHCQQMTLTFAF